MRETNQNNPEIPAHTNQMMKKSGDIRCWCGYGEKGTLHHCWWNCKLVQPLWQSVWRFLSKLNIVLPEDPGIPLLGIYLQAAPTCNFWHMLHYVHSTLIYSSQNLERTQMSFNRGMVTENVVYLHKGVWWIHEILKQMEGTRKHHPEWGNPITTEHTWY